MEEVETRSVWPASAPRASSRVRRLGGSAAAARRTRTPRAARPRSRRRGRNPAPRARGRAPRSLGSSGWNGRSSRLRMSSVSPSCRMIERNPSHFGSYRQPGPSGISPRILASIGGSHNIWVGSIPLIPHAPIQPPAGSSLRNAGRPTGTRARSRSNPFVSEEPQRGDVVRVDSTVRGNPGRSAPGSFRRACTRRVGRRDDQHRPPDDDIRPVRLAAHPGASPSRFRVHPRLFETHLFGQLVWVARRLASARRSASRRSRSTSLKST